MLQMQQMVVFIIKVCSIPGVWGLSLTPIRAILKRLLSFLGKPLPPRSSELADSTIISFYYSTPRTIISYGFGIIFLWRWRISFSSLRPPQLPTSVFLEPSAGIRYSATIRGWSGRKSRRRSPRYCVLEPTVPLHRFQTQVWLPLPTHMPMAFWICLSQKGQRPKLNGSTARSRACISNF